MSHCIIGLTGGIGSGKSTVADLFVAQGCQLVDTDAIAHELTAAHGAAMAALLAAFGPQIAQADGSLNRATMRQLAFSDPDAKKRLETILHPMIRQTAAERCQLATTPYVLLAVPLLIEAGDYRQRCDRILVVDCLESSQIKRVQSRSQLSEAEVRAILASQISRSERLAAADDVIENEGKISDLATVVAELHAKYLSLSAKKLTQAIEI